MKINIGLKALVSCGLLIWVFAAPLSCKLEETAGNTVIVDLPTPEEPSENRIAQLLIIELQVNYTNSNAEFIGFKVIRGGTLESLTLISVYNVENRQDQPLVYKFKPVNVEEGDLLTLHLRTLDADISFDELGDDITESGGKNSSDTARDFWLPGTSIKWLATSSIAYIQDAKGNIQDAVKLSSDINDARWSKNSIVRSAALEKVSTFLNEAGAWNTREGGERGTASAVDTSSLGQISSRSVLRDMSMPNTNSTADWFIGPATPGKPNPARP